MYLQYYILDGLGYYSGYNLFQLHCFVFSMS